MKIRCDTATEWDELNTPFVFWISYYLYIHYTSCIRMNTQSGNVTVLYTLYNLIQICIWSGNETKYEMWKMYTVQSHCVTVVQKVTTYEIFFVGHVQHVECSTVGVGLLDGWDVLGRSDGVQGVWWQCCNKRSWTEVPWETAVRWAIFRLHTRVEQGFGMH